MAGSRHSTRLKSVSVARTTAPAPHGFQQALGRQLLRDLHQVAARNAVALCNPGEGDGLHPAVRCNTALQGTTPAHFAAWAGLWQAHTRCRFTPGLARELQAVAHSMARDLFKGYFGSPPAFAPLRHGHGQH